MRSPIIIRRFHQTSAVTESSASPSLAPADDGPSAFAPLFVFQRATSAGVDAANLIRTADRTRRKPRKTPNCSWGGRERRGVGPVIAPCNYAWSRLIKPTQRGGFRGGGGEENQRPRECHRHKGRSVLPFPPSSLSLSLSLLSPAFALASSAYPSIRRSAFRSRIFSIPENRLGSVIKMNAATMARIRYAS